MNLNFKDNKTDKKVVQAKQGLNIKQFIKKARKEEKKNNYQGW